MPEATGRNSSEGKRKATRVGVARWKFRGVKKSRISEGNLARIPWQWLA